MIRPAHRMFPVCRHSSPFYSSFPQGAPRYLGEQNDDHHPPDRQKGVSDRIRHGIAERRNLAFCGFADKPDRRGTGARPGAAAEQNGGIETKDETARQHADNERHRCGGNPPQEQTDADLPDAGDEAASRGNADRRQETADADRRHEPHGRARDAPEGRMDRAQPTEDQTGDERPACRRDGERNRADRDDERAYQRAGGYRQADEGDVGGVGRPISVTEIRRCDGDVLLAAGQRQDVAAMDLCRGQDRNIRGVTRV